MVCRQKNRPQKKIVQLPISYITSIPKQILIYPQDASGYVTDEELELRQTLEPSEVTTSTKQQQQTHKPPLSTLPNSIQVSMEASKAVVTDAESSIVSATSPSKEVLIGGDNNPSRRYVCDDVVL